MEEPAIVDLREAEDFTMETTKKEMSVIGDTKLKVHKPAEAMDKCIDRFFYGSTDRREKMLKERFHGMVENFTPQLLVGSIEIDHEYSIPPDFKQKYFTFLNQLAN